MTSTTYRQGFALPLSSLSRAIASRTLLGAIAVLGCTAAAHADFQLSVMSSGAELTLSPGQEFSALVMLEGPAADRHNSCIFSLLLTAPGLEILGYDWASPYQSASPYEFSSPGAAALPALITPDLFVKPQAPELNDLEFSNVVDPDSGVSTAGVGLLLRATFAVPMGYSGPQHVYLFAIPDTFANGFDVIPTQIGRGVSLHIIVPAPSSLLGVLMAGCVLGHQRRRRV